MKEEKNEPAKVIGKVDLKKDGKRKGSSEVENGENVAGVEAFEAFAETPADSLEDDHFSHSATDEEAPEAPDSSNDVGNSSNGVIGFADIEPAALESIPASLREAFSSDGPDSMREIIERHSAQDKGEAPGGTNAIFKAVEFPKVQPTVNQKVQAVCWFMVVWMMKGMLWTGRYLLHYEFGGDVKKALSKNPSKGTSLNEMAKHEDMPLSRQRLCECVRVAAVDAELETLGVKRDGVTYCHLLEISRLGKQEQRVEVVNRTRTQALTIGEVRTLVKEMMGKPTSSDRQLGTAVMRQIAQLARLATDEDTKNFLLDKERLRAALTPEEALHFLEESKKCRGAMDESGEILKGLEDTLKEIVVHSMQPKKSEPANSAATTSD